MPTVLQVLVTVLCLGLFILVVRLVIKGRLLLKYSLIWMLLTLVALVCAIFPDITGTLAAVLGFAVSSNFVFLIAVFFLLVIALSLSVIVSWQTQYIKNLLQDMALIEKRIEELEDR